MEVSPALFESIFHSVEEHIAVIQRSGEIIACNQAWQRFGFENGIDAEFNWIGQNYLDVLKKSCAAGDLNASDILSGMLTVVHAGVSAFSYEYPCHSPTRQRWFTMRITILQGVEPDYFVITHHDITQRKIAEQRAEALSLQDPLTGLGNRRLFDASLIEALRLSQRDQTWIGLLLIDVDHFKSYNDEFGHLAGDLCLRKVAAVLQAHARRPGDIAMRIGGDEFALLVRITASSDLTTMAESVLQDVRHLQMSFANGQLLTVSIGVIAVVAQPQLSADTLYQTVDQALYQAKVAGRNQVVLVPQHATGTLSVPQTRPRAQRSKVVPSQTFRSS